MGFDSIQDLVQYYKGSLFKNPYLNPSSELTSIISKWKTEIVELEKDLDDIFSAFLDDNSNENSNNNNNDGNPFL